MARRSPREPAANECRLRRSATGYLIRHSTFSNISTIWSATIVAWCRRSSSRNPATAGGVRLPRVRLVQQSARDFYDGVNMLAV